MADGRGAVTRAAVTLSVPARGGEHSEPVAKGQWALNDGFAPSVGVDAVTGDITPTKVIAAFLSGISQDRVALHRALEDGFETAVTLADPGAYSTLVERIKQHFSTLGATADAMCARLRDSGQSPLAQMLEGVNKLEASRLERVLQLQSARQRVSSAQFEADAELKADAAALATKVNEITAELNEALSELRAEAQDLED